MDKNSVFLKIQTDISKYCKKICNNMYYNHEDLLQDTYLSWINSSYDLNNQIITPKEFIKITANMLYKNFKNKNKNMLDIELIYDINSSTNSDYDILAKEFIQIVNSFIISNNLNKENKLFISFLLKGYKKQDIIKELKINEYIYKNTYRKIIPKLRKFLLETYKL